MATKKLNTKLKAGQIIELMSGTTRYKIIKIWDGYESGFTTRPVVWGNIQKVKRDGTLVKSEKPINKILEFHYGGKPMINGTIIK